ncbi:MAG: DUF5675 family protein [Nitrospirales bacterium]|nr:DUF5675 family protein [Nitrospirales bacterium]
MRLTLNRYLYHPWGIFSRWIRDDGSQLMVSLTHAFAEAETWLPIVKPGEYVMRRYQSPHFGLVWEICDVPGHTYILVHAGNFNLDSEGCEVVGEDIAIGDDPRTQGPDEMVTNSKAALKKFMAETAAEDVLYLTVNG